jgi:hypothetical protein
VLLLELRRAETAERGMQASLILDLIDELREVCYDLVEGIVGYRVDGLDLQRLPGAFDFGIVVWIGVTPQCADEIMRRQELAVDPDSILRSSIGAMDAAGL